MYRINTELRRQAPAAVQFVSNTTDADLQILDVIGLGSFEYLRMPEHALLQHCFLTTETQDAGYWLSRFRAARLVMSYHDLPSLTGASDFSFYQAPWGVDGVAFHSFDVPRDLGILTTGYDPNGEAIFECFAAARRVNLPVMHVGRNFGPMAGVFYRENITDKELATYYSRARYVSGLRRGEGFELPVLEGLVCGARPICFDTSASRHWFGDHAVFVPECSHAQLTDILAEILGRVPAPVTPEERRAVLDHFSWRSIFRAFWSRLLAASP